MKAKNILLCGAQALLAGCGQVDSGYTGLKLAWGRVVSEPRQKIERAAWSVRRKKDWA